MSEYILGIIMIAIGGIHILAHRLRWGWYMNNWQSRPMREAWGETGFALFTYVTCAACIGFGIYTFI